MGRDGASGYLLFSDIPGNRIMKFEEETGKTSVFRANANYANGNARDRQGRLVTCEHSVTRRVTRTEADGKITVLADRFKGKRLNAPNDVVVNPDGGVDSTALSTLLERPVGQKPASPRYDLARFGAEAPRFSPRQSDLLWVVGTISQRNAPILKRIYEQMCEPKWVIAFGTCASTGGFYDNYATVPGIDKIIPVDVYIPGCPPRPEQILDALMLIMDRIGSGDARGIPLVASGERAT